MAKGSKQKQHPNDSGLNFEAQLWAAADKMRGHMDASEYKHVCLGLNRLNLFLRDHGLGIHKEQKRDLAVRIISVLGSRRSEADADDFSRMAWLAIHSGQESLARDFVEAGLGRDAGNYHLVKLAQRLGIPC